MCAPGVSNGEILNENYTLALKKIRMYFYPSSTPTPAYILTNDPTTMIKREKEKSVLFMLENGIVIALSPVSLLYAAK